MPNPTTTRPTALPGLASIAAAALIAGPVGLIISLLIALIVLLVRSARR